MGEEQWSIQDGELCLEAPFAKQVEPGDKLYLPARGTWSQGMPVRITGVMAKGTDVCASYVVMSVQEALESYQEENVILYPDYNNIVLGDGVSLKSMPATRSAVGESWNAERTFSFEKEYENGVVVSGEVKFSLTATASVDYELSLIHI